MKRVGLVGVGTMGKHMAAQLLKKGYSVTVCAHVNRAPVDELAALGMATTAEGIETPELADTLSGVGCTTGQGYLYAEPMGADAALNFARQSLG